MKEVEECQQWRKEQLKKTEKRTERSYRREKKGIYQEHMWWEHGIKKKSTLLFNGDEDKGTKSVLVWDIMQHIVVIPYRCFGTSYRSRFQGSRMWRMPVTLRYTVYIGTGVGGYLFSLSLMPANTFDAVW